MKAAIVIPARLASTRLPRKLLLPLGGKPIVVQTCIRAAAAQRAAQLVVATDSDEIAAAVRLEGFEAVMTRADHQSGTDRVAEAAARIDADVLVNVQGDEPDIDPASIDALIEAQARVGACVSTLVCRFPEGVDPADPARVKAALGDRLAEETYRAVYFSRAPIPHPREGRADYHLHIGVYAYRRECLLRIAAAPPCPLEETEKLEQLRIISMGETIAARRVTAAAPGIDTMADYEAAVRRFSRRENGAR